MNPLRVCIICDSKQLAGRFSPMHRELDAQFITHRVFVDDNWPASIRELPDYNQYDVIMWFVKFRHLAVAPPFDWCNYPGLRVMYDFDAYQNFSLMGGNRFLGAWPPVFRSQGFHLILATGKQTTENLRENRVTAEWVPKAYDDGAFFDKGLDRQGLCYFGEPYAARAAMLHFLHRQRLTINRFRCSYASLNDHLNRYSACLICNMVGTKPRLLPRIVSRIAPSSLIKVSPGPEPMAKNFEVPGSGCVAFCDHIPELHDLGFKDGETLITYQDFPELGDKLKHYLNNPDLLRPIAKAAIRLCRDRNTWRHRAMLMDTIFRRYL
jgi:hypothetical protein